MAFFHLQRILKAPEEKNIYFSVACFFSQLFITENIFYGIFLKAIFEMKMCRLFYLGSMSKIP